MRLILSRSLWPTAGDVKPSHPHPASPALRERGANRLHLVAASAIGLMLLAGGAAAEGEGAAPPFRMPLNCEYGKTCFIQNYVDHDPGPGRADYRCGRLSYDGHHGTDFRLRDEVDMERGVYVVAAAPGVVKAIRDGMADISVREVSPE